MTQSREERVFEVRSRSPAGQIHANGAHRDPDAEYRIEEIDTAGFRTFRRDLPATCVPWSAGPEALGLVARDMLQALDLRPEVPVQNNHFPLLRQAKVRSWRDLIKTSATVDVVRLGGVFAIGTWVRDRSRLDGHQVAGERGHAVLQDPTVAELGDALRIAADAVEP